ncbi:MAG: hypothetical protein ACE5JX_04880 [Acidobacteriota bacterium]
MVQKKKLAFLDTNLFVIDLRYKRDANYGANLKCLATIRRHHQAITSIFNLLELCGILSFNLNRQQLMEFYHFFPQRYKLRVLPYSDPSLALPPFEVDEILRIILNKASFGDAMIVASVRRYLPQIDFLVSWDAKHFKNQLVTNVLTPIEFLDLTED